MASLLLKNSIVESGFDLPGKIYQILLTVICINPLANKPILQLGIRSTICNGYKKSSEAKNAADNFIFSGLICGDCLLPAIIARAVLAGGKICTLLSTLYSVQGETITDNSTQHTVLSLTRHPKKRATYEATILSSMCFPAFFSAT